MKITQSSIKLGAITAIASVSLAYQQVHAASIIYESFSQSTGGLNGVTGGTGVNSWSSPSGYSVASSALDYGDLANAGNLATSNNQSSPASGSIDGGLASAGLLDNGAELWFSFVTTGASGSNAHTGFAFGTAATAASFNGINLPGDGVGVYFRQGNIQAQTWNGGTRGTLSSTQSISVGSANLIVGRINWGATASDLDTITLYSPNLASLYTLTPGTLGPGITATSTVALNQGAMNIISFNTRGTTQVYDEIRFGSSYYSVTPLPEPSTTALLGLGGLALILRRRK